jgi:hypothetical protein
LNKLSKAALCWAASILIAQSLSAQHSNSNEVKKSIERNFTRGQVAKEPKLPWLADELPSSPITNNGNATLESLGVLESSRDPKCHATATRLEALIYGTPLSNNARYRKTEYQKQFVRHLWEMAKESNNSSSTPINLAQLQKVTPTWYKGVFGSAVDNKLVWPLSFANQKVEVTQRDLDHYGSIAYSLRAILAVQQDQLLADGPVMPQLTAESVQHLTHLTDMLTLALLQVADKAARQQNQYEISEQLLVQAWFSLFPEDSSPIGKVQIVGSPREVIDTEKNQNSGLLKQIVEQKLNSYEAYNQVNNQLFSRNLQVYFALATLPQDEKQNLNFRTTLTQAMVGFAESLYTQANSEATEHNVINEAAVQRALDVLLPHDVNSYEDVIFFPKYPKSQQVVIESYDMDAFRDSGLHWHYLANALDNLEDARLKEADPFAAELLTEGIAHFGVLLLRLSGAEAKIAQDTNEPYLMAENVVTAWRVLDEKISAYGDYVPPAVTQTNIVSAEQEKGLTDSYFTRVDELFNFSFEHRSSDWLSRQLRSYLKKDQSTGNITIPPAFGGSGVAAEDIDNDGLTDILILGGKGNKLLKNTGNGFVDITQYAGLQWLRASDGLPGEPRQPLIADLDNDGDQDIVITYVNDLHRVYSNNGNGTFKDVSSKANLGGLGLTGGPATLLDVNNDGLLDLYIAYFGNYINNTLPTLKRVNTNGTANQLFLNTGNFTFQKMPNAMGADNTGWGQAITHTDINQDGWQDIIVGNDFGINAYFLNLEGKGFADAAKSLGTDKPSYTMNVSLSDLNQDGIPDVYISNIVTMNKDERYVLPSEDTQAKFNPDKLSNMRVVEGNDLFMSNLDQQRLQFSLSDKVGRGDTSTGWAWGAEFFDADNDGDDDLYVVNGMNDYFLYSSRRPYHEGAGNVFFPDASKASNVFYLNSGGWLKNQSTQSGLDIVANSRSVAYLDLEGDGDLDVLVNNYHDKAALFRNNAEKLKNNWLKITLVGAPQHGISLDAIGAQVLIGFGSDGYVWRQVSSSQGYLSAQPKTLQFGLGKESRARVTVIWPNGQREVFGVLEANKSYQLSYGLKR